MGLCGCTLLARFDDRDAPSNGSAGAPGCELGEKTCGGACVSIDDPAFGCNSADCSPCAFPNAAGHRCVNGACALDGCAAGFFDCDEENSSGCETNVAADPLSCGSCENDCTATDPSSIWECAGGVCAESKCTDNPLFGNCGDSVGCTVPLTTVQNCGFCGNRCVIPGAIAECAFDGTDASGRCAIKSCIEGFANCDDNSDNGCETHLLTNPLHCGRCNDPCLGDCADGSCRGVDS